VVVVSATGPGVSSVVGVGGVVVSSVVVGSAVVVPGVVRGGGAASDGRSPRVTSTVWFFPSRNTVTFSASPGSVSSRRYVSRSSLSSIRVSFMTRTTSPGKVTKFFGLYEHDALEQKSLTWLSKRETARYVDFDGSDLSIPEENFDESDAEEILEDAEATIESVTEQIEE
jgi:hypothetical protein